FFVFYACINASIEPTAVEVAIRPLLFYFPGEFAFSLVGFCMPFSVFLDYVKRVTLRIRRDDCPCYEKDGCDEMFHSQLHYWVYDLNYIKSIPLRPIMKEPHAEPGLIGFLRGSRCAH